MALTEEQWAGLLAYCRMEEPTEEERRTLEGLYEAAVGYLENAGVTLPPEGTPRRAQYELCVHFNVLRLKYRKNGFFHPRRQRLCDLPGPLGQCSRLIAVFL